MLEGFTPHARKMKQKDIILVKNIYYNNSFNLPSQTKAGKVALEKSLPKLHIDFLRESNNSISLSKFGSVRPKDVITVNKIKFETCLCEYCINMEFMVKAVTQIRCLATTESKHIDINISNKFEAVNAT